MFQRMSYDFHKNATIYPWHLFQIPSYNWSDPDPNFEGFAPAIRSAMVPILNQQSCSKMYKYFKQGVQDRKYNDDFRSTIYYIFVFKSSIQFLRGGG